MFLMMSRAMFFLPFANVPVPLLFSCADSVQSNMYDKFLLHDKLKKKKNRTCVPRMWHCASTAGHTFLSLEHSWD